MRIYRPIGTNKQTQKFGANNACISTSSSKVISKKGLTCPQGYKPLYESLGLKGHNGEDWKLYTGEKIYFPVSADTTWTAKTEVDPYGGKGIDVFSDRMIEIDGDFHHVKFRFWHLHDFNVYDGQKVMFGQVIGFGGSTGLSSGPHLHWSMKLVDSDGVTLNGGNGYTGAVDFSKHFENRFTPDVLNAVIKEAKSAIEYARRFIQYVKLFFLPA